MMRTAFVITAAAFALAGCGEEPQTADGSKRDAALFQGTGKPFVTSGWKPGDQASWEQHLKTRTQRGQNDYTKVN